MLIGKRTRLSAQARVASGGANVCNGSKADKLLEGAGNCGIACPAPARDEHGRSTARSSEEK